MYREAPATFDPRLTRCDHLRSASEIEVVCSNELLSSDESLSTSVEME